MFIIDKILDNSMFEYKDYLNSFMYKFKRIFHRNQNIRCSHCNHFYVKTIECETIPGLTEALQYICYCNIYFGEPTRDDKKWCTYYIPIEETKNE